MYYIVEERDWLADLIGFIIMLFIVQWEFDTLIALLPGILAFLASVFVLCTVIIRLAENASTDARLDHVRSAGINPFASIGCAVDAIADALPPGLHRYVRRPNAATEEAVLFSGVGGLLAFGLACYASGALASWQHTGRWSPLIPSLAAAAGALAGAWCARSTRRRPDRTRPRPQPLELLDHPTISLVDPIVAPGGRITDEIA